MSQYTKMLNCTDRDRRRLKARQATKYVTNHPVFGPQASKLNFKVFFHTYLYLSRY